MTHTYSLTSHLAFFNHINSVLRIDWDVIYGFDKEAIFLMVAGGKMPSISGGWWILSDLEIRASVVLVDLVVITFLKLKLKESCLKHTFAQTLAKQKMSILHNKKEANLSY